MHLAVAHSVSALAAGCVHYNFAREFAQWGIEMQRTLLQVKSSANCVQHIAKREIDGRALRVELNCQVLRGSRDLHSREKCNRRQERAIHGSSAKRAGASFYWAKQSVAPIPG